MIEHVDVREPAVNSDHCTIHLARGASTSKEQP